MLFAVDNFGDKGEDGLSNFALESALGGEEGGFDELLGDGGAALELLFEEGAPGSADNALSVESVVAIEVFIFYGDGGFKKVIGEVIYGDGAAILVGVDFKQKFAVAIEDLGGGRKGFGGA